MGQSAPGSKDNELEFHHQMRSNVKPRIPLFVKERVLNLSTAYSHRVLSLSNLQKNDNF